MKTAECHNCGKRVRVFCHIEIFDRGALLGSVEQCKNCNPFVPLAVRELRKRNATKAAKKAAKGRSR
jgi:hypothetical protein